MWPVLAGIVGIASALVSWYVANHPRIRYRKLLDRIRELQDAIGPAVAEGDLDRIAELNHELRRLRETQQVLAGL